MFLEMKDIYLDKGKFEDWEDMYRNLWSREESARYMLWNVTGSEEAARDRMQRSIEFQKSHDTGIAFGLEKFIYSCRSKNEASRRLALSCGFTYTHSQDKIDSRNGESYVLEFYEKNKVCYK